MNTFTEKTMTPVSTDDLEQAVSLVRVYTRLQGSNYFVNSAVKAMNDRGWEALLNDETLFETDIQRALYGFMAGYALAQMRFAPEAQDPDESTE